MKPFFLRVTAGFLSALLLLFLAGRYGFPEALGYPELAYFAHTSGKGIEVYRDGSWEPFFMIGVDMGTGKPGCFPNELGVTEEEYLRWFGYIGALHANCVRVYMLQSPAFYRALKQYNGEAAEPLYLLQGYYLPEGYMYTTTDVWTEAFRDSVSRELRATIDALHGERIRLLGEDAAFTLYSEDVSGYVLGYILGVEWETDFVSFNDVLSEGRTYRGEFLSASEEATGFECFLAWMGDAALSYEWEKYRCQRLLALSNWPLTDPLPHGDTVLKREVTVDTEHIIPSEKLKTGIFASYHVYPTYPEFLKLGRYAEETAGSDQSNPYRAYLAELDAHHAVPVVISEYGTSPGRGRAYQDPVRGFHQGGLSEEEQGNASAALFEDIRASGCAGCVLFSWQDEWFKQAWNAKLTVDKNNIVNWSDAQTNEQFYGLLTFDPGWEQSVCYPDGDLSDWADAERAAGGGGFSVAVQQDEKYLYFLISKEGWRPGEQELLVALDVTPKSGAFSYGDLSFSRAADFMLSIRDETDAALLVQEYYDTNLSIYAWDSSAAILATPERKDNPVFCVAVMGSDSRHTYLGANGKAITTDALTVETGKLVYGNGNPSAEEFNSLADYCFAGDTVEVRLAWQLLNFYDPPTAQVRDDYYEDYKIEGLPIRQIFLEGFCLERSGGNLVSATGWGAYALQTWKEPTYHERLKQSYYIMQSAFGAAAG